MSTTYIGLCKLTPKNSVHVLGPKTHLSYDIKKTSLGKCLANNSLW